LGRSPRERRRPVRGFARMRSGNVILVSGSIRRSRRSPVDAASIDCSSNRSRPLASMTHRQPADRPLHDRRRRLRRRRHSWRSSWQVPAMLYGNHSSRRGGLWERPC
jgi:hypothetical protein